MAQTIVSQLKKAPAPVRRIYRDFRATVLSLGLSSNGDFVQPDREVQASQDMSIVVPVKDAPIVVDRCFASLERFAPKAEVIVVDDGSLLEETLSTIERFSSRNGWRVIRNSSGIGHSKCCESGANVATKPYLCLLNSDTIVTPWSWWAAKDAFEADLKIGVTGPTTSNSATDQMLRRAMHCRHYWNDSEIFSFAGQYISKLAPRSWVDLPEVGGFAFFIRRELWERLGGFDPNLPDYGNESELCVRIWKMGMRVVWTQNSYIHHLGQQSYGDIGDPVVGPRSVSPQDYIRRKHYEGV